LVETTLKTLIERFRSKPEWQHGDPAVRAEAVLRLSSSEREVLTAIAQGDADPRVRRAAVKKLSEVALLSGIAAGDADPSVREEAETRLAHLAVHEPLDESALAAVAGLRDPRQLGLVARTAPLAAAREAAIRALDDPRTLATIVREADDPTTRLSALARIEDAATLLGLALKLEHKTVAVAAVDRIADREALQTIANKARAGAAARRAKAKLEPVPEPAAAPPAAPSAPSFDDEAERQAYERARLAHEREAAARLEAVAARTRIAESLETAAGEAIPSAIESARREREALTPAAGAELEALGRRLDEALAAAERRHAAFLAGLANRAQLEEIVQQAEQLAEADLAAARPAFTTLEARWSELTASAQLPELTTRFQAVAARMRSRQDAARAEQAQHEQEHLHKLSELADRAEAVVRKGGAAALRDADQALREIKDALDHPGHFPTRRDRDAVLARLESARKGLYPLVQQLREDAEWKRWANINVQEELCAQAEALVQEPDAEKAAHELRDLDARWKQAKEAPKDKAEALWIRFKAARDQVKTRTDAYFAKQAEELAENLKKKEALCERAEVCAESSDWLKTADELRALQAEWKAIGPVPRAVSQRVWERFRRPCDQFFTRWQEHRNQRSHEWAENLHKKEALCERAEALRESSDWEATSAELKRLQAEWRTIGAVKKSRSDAVWQRFRTACDVFFDRYKNRDEHARQAARTAREAICDELEALLPADTTDAAAPPELAARLQAAQTAWRQAGSLPQELMAALDERFTRVRDGLLEAFPAAFAGTDLDPEASRGKAERLLARVEALLQELAPAPATPQASSAAELAARLRDALASNTIGGREAVDAKWQSAAAELESAQLAWKRLGPLAGSAGRALVERFEQACRRFGQLRPRVERPPEPRHRSEGRRGEGRGPRPPR
jgi:hypothetical protein